MPYLPKLICIATVLCSVTLGFARENEESSKPPAVGEKAPDFSLMSHRGDTVTLSGSVKKGPTVVVVLRGYPGYQCPLCTRQVGSLLNASREFAARKAQVVLVYPGPARGLDKRAQEFLKDAELPKHFSLVIDPAYKFTNAYHLRWDAPRETAYPSTFVVGMDGKVDYAVVSKSHGGRADTRQVLEAIQ